MASIPPRVVNLIGDARVVRAHIGLQRSGIPGVSRSCDPAARLEDAIAPAIGRVGRGLRSACFDLTSGASVWFDANLRFSAFETADEAAERRARFRSLVDTPPKPHGRPRKKR